MLDDSPFQALAPCFTKPPTKTVTGGISWQILDSRASVQDEISSVLLTLTNTGANYHWIPSYFYGLSMLPKTVTVILQWSGDTVSYGLGTDFGTGYLPRHQSSLQQFRSTECDNLREALSFMTSQILSPEWVSQAQNVHVKLDKLRDSIQPDCPLRTWMERPMGVWLATLANLEEDASRLPCHLKSSKKQTH